MSEINLAFLCLAFVAEILGTIGGFGSSVLFVPIAAYFLPFDQVLGLTAFFHLSSNISKIALFRHGLDKHLLLKLGIPAVIFVLIGSALTSYVDKQYSLIALYLFLILFSAFLLLKPNYQIEASGVNSAVGGSLSGFLAGFLGTGGAIRGLTMASYNLPLSVFIATSASIDLCVDFTRSIVYYSKGYVTSQIYYYIPAMLVIGLLGSYIGKRILMNLSQNEFKKITLIFILLIGLFGLVFSKELG